MRIDQFLRDYGSVLTIGLQAVWFALTWWFRKSVATKGDLAAVVESVESAVRRIVQLETAAENAPDANDIASLRLEMAHHTGQMREFGVTLSGARETISAQFEGLHGRLDGIDRLMGRAETMVNTLTRHLLDANR